MCGHMDIFTRLQSACVDIKGKQCSACYDSRLEHSHAASQEYIALVRGYH